MGVEATNSPGNIPPPGTSGPSAPGQPTTPNNPGQEPTQGTSGTNQPTETGEVAEGEWGEQGWGTDSSAENNAATKTANDTAKGNLLSRIQSNSNVILAQAHEATHDIREAEGQHQANVDEARAEISEGRSDIDRHTNDQRSNKEVMAARYNALLSGIPANKGGTGVRLPKTQPQHPAMAQTVQPNSKKSQGKMPAADSPQVPKESLNADHLPLASMANRQNMPGGRTTRQQGFLNALQQRMLNGECSAEEAVLYNQWLNVFEEDPSAIPSDLLAQFTGEEVDERDDAADSEVPLGEEDHETESSTSAEQKRRTTRTEVHSRAPDPEGAIRALAGRTPPPLRRGKSDSEGAEESPQIVSLSAAVEGAVIMFGSQTEGVDPGAKTLEGRRANTALSAMQQGIALYLQTDRPVHDILFGEGNSHDAVAFTEMEAPQGPPQHLLRGENPTRVDGVVIRSPDGKNAVSMTDDMILRKSRESREAGGDGSFEVRVGNKTVTIHQQDVEMIARSAGIRRERQTRAFNSYGVIAA